MLLPDIDPIPIRTSSNRRQQSRHSLSPHSDSDYRPQSAASRPPLGIPDNTTDTGHSQRRPALPAIKNSHSQLAVRLWHPQRCTTITLLYIYRPHHRYCLNERTTIVSIFSCLEVRQGKERESLTLGIILPHQQASRDHTLRHPQRELKALPLDSSNTPTHPLDPKVVVHPLLSVSRNVMGASPDPMVRRRHPFLCVDC